MSAPGERLVQIARAEAAGHARYAVWGRGAVFGPLVAVHVGPDSPLSAAWHDGTRLPTAAELRGFEHFCHECGQVPALHLLSPLFPDGPEWLGARGYALKYTLNAYLHDLRTLPDVPGMDIREGDPASWAALSAAGFGPGSEGVMATVAQTPGTRLFVADQGGVPAASAALSVVGGPGGTVAALHGTSTLPAFRGSGLQRALLVHRLYVAVQEQAGLATVFVTPGSGSERNILRAGFVRVGERLTFSRPLSPG